MLKSFVTSILNIGQKMVKVNFLGGVKFPEDLVLSKTVLKEMAIYWANSSVSNLPVFYRVTQYILSFGLLFKIAFSICI